VVKFHRTLVLVGAFSQNYAMKMEKHSFE